jgi:GT2 family glycosyltransferase
MPPVVSVIVPTFRRYEPVLNTLDDLLRQRDVVVEAVVADQNDEWPAEYQDRRARLAADPRVRWLTIRPPGVVAARNEAVRQSTGDVLVFVDDDVKIRNSEFLARHARNYADPAVAGVIGRERAPDAADDGAVAAGPPADWTDRPPLGQVFGFGRDTDQPAWVCTFSTCNGSVRRSAFLAVGGFDENFTGNSYGDDYDLALRMFDRGFRFRYDPSAALVHLKAPMGGLRLSDPANAFDHSARAVCQWLFYLRHARPGYRLSMLWKHVLRKTVFLKANVVRPWRQWAAWRGLMAAYFEARRRLARGPVSRFLP